MFTFCLAALIIPVVTSKCFYTNQTYNEHTWPTIYILNPFDDEGNPIAGNCTIHADSGSDFRKLWHFQLQQFIKTDDSEDAYIDILNGDGSPLFTHINSVTSTSSSIFTVSSSTRNVIINVYVPSTKVSIVGQMEGTPMHMSKLDEDIVYGALPNNDKVLARRGGVNPKFR